MGMAFSQTIILMNEIRKKEHIKNKNMNDIKYSKINIDDTNNNNNVNN